MKPLLRLIAVLLSVGLVTVATADEGHPMGGGKNGIKGMSQDNQIKLALGAAPEWIAKNAAVMVPGDDGKLVEVKKGTNGFTCIPTVNNRPIPDPMCMDGAVMQWVNDLISKAPKPTNTVPGIAYMARGGWHWERDGKVLMEEEPGAKLVKEPPHWMVMWPFDSQAVGLPDKPNPGGVYVMFNGTPYAHLMIYQDPHKLKLK